MKWISDCGMPAGHVLAHSSPKPILYRFYIYSSTKVYSKFGFEMIGEVETPCGNNRSMLKEPCSLYL